MASHSALNSHLDPRKERRAISTIITVPIASFTSLMLSRLKMARAPASPVMVPQVSQIGDKPHSTIHDAKGPAQESKIKVIYQLTANPTAG